MCRMGIDTNRPSKPIVFVLFVCFCFAFFVCFFCFVFFVFVNKPPLEMGAAAITPLFLSHEKVTIRLPLLNSGCFSYLCLLCLFFSFLFSFPCFFFFLFSICFSVFAFMRLLIIFFVINSIIYSISRRSSRVVNKAARGQTPAGARHHDGCAEQPRHTLLHGTRA